MRLGAPDASGTSDTPPAGDIRRMTHRRSAILVCCILTFMFLAASPPTLDARQPIFNGSSLAGWSVENTEAGVRDGVIRVKNGNGWVRTVDVYANFVMSLDVRVTDEDATAGVYLRAWPTFDRSRAPTNAYRLRLAEGKTAAKGEWMHLEIECIGQTARVRLGDQVVFTANAVGNPQGHVALWSKGGTAEFKNIALRKIEPPRAVSPLPNVFEVGGAVSAPRLIFDPKPRYNERAMRARITGTVIISAVVRPDGTVGDIAVLQSLDPTLGLDQEAVATARRWRFSPGTRDGSPVPVRVRIELTFNLK
jgi:TonB family protein